MVEIAITGAGCVLTSEASAHVFDRFWRVRALLSEIGSHCGPGLTRVCDMAGTLRGSASVEVQDGVFTVRLILPATPASAKSAG